MTSSHVVDYRPEPSLRAVISGTGAVQARLASVLSDQGAQRPMVVCGSNVSRSPVFDLVLGALGKRPVVFDRVRPHTPVETVDAGAALARHYRVDALIALGGSSSVDCAKGIARLVVSGVDAVAGLAPIDLAHLGPAPAARPDAMTFITITTTLSFAEFLPFWGARHPEIRRKLPYADDGTVARTIFLDGAVAADTPDHIWAETGVKALDDAISAYCRADGNDPFRDPVNVAAIAALDEWLPRSLGEDRAIERQHVLTAVWMTKFPLPRLARSGLTAWFSTAARHALGGVFELPHGVGSCVALPVAVRAHADTTHHRQLELAKALGWPAGDPPLEPGLTRLLGRLGVPTSLGSLGIAVTPLDAVVDNILAEAPQMGSHEEVRRLCQLLW